MKNPYEGSQVVPVDGRVSRTTFQLFRRRAVRGATFGAVLLGGLMLAMLLYLQNRAIEVRNTEKLLQSVREWSDTYAFGLPLLIVVPSITGLIGAVFGAVLGTAYHLVAQLARLLFRGKSNQ